MHMNSKKSIQINKLSAELIILKPYSKNLLSRDVCLIQDCMHQITSKSSENQISIYDIPANTKHLYNIYIPSWPNVFDVGSALYTCYTNG